MRIHENLSSVCKAVCHLRQINYLLSWPGLGVFKYNSYGVWTVWHTYFYWQVIVPEYSAEGRAFVTSFLVSDHYPNYILCSSNCSLKLLLAV